MRVLLALTLAILGFSSTAFAEKTLVVNCAEEVSEENTVKSLKAIANDNGNGIEVQSLKAGMEIGKKILDGDELPLESMVIANIKNSKILSIQTPQMSVKRYCLVLEGEVLSRGQLK